MTDASVRDLDLMDVSVRALAGEGSSLREVAGERGFDAPFSVRETVTPQTRGPSGFEEASWTNWVDDHSKDSGERQRITPTTKNELLTAVLKQSDPDSDIRAVGSGHSHSNAAAPREHFIDLNPDDSEEALSGLLPQPWLKPTDDIEGIDGDTSDLVRVKAGTTIRRLNRRLLAPQGLAVLNMGSFDGQTVAGAVNTGTHGTGIELGTFADVVRSVEIVTVPESWNGEPVVQMYRIEPDEGITDPDLFEQEVADHGMTLIQDDEVFHSTVVGYGAMGVVYAYTFEVRDDYWLSESSDLWQWNELKQELGYGTSGAEARAEVQRFLKGSRHLQFQLNLAGVQTDSPQNPICMVRRHRETEPRPEPDDWRWTLPLNCTALPDIGNVENSIDQVRDGLRTACRTADAAISANISCDFIDQLDEGQVVDLYELATDRCSEASGSSITVESEYLTLPYDDRWPPERRQTPFKKLGKEIGDVHPLQENLGTRVRGELLRANHFRPTARQAPFVGDRYQTASYIALRRLRDGDPENPSEPNPPPKAISTEVSVPLENLVDAIEAVMEKIRPSSADNVQYEARGESYDVYFSPPMGVRFVDRGEHALAPEYERHSAMIEVPFLVKTVGSDDGPIDLSNKEDMLAVGKAALGQIESMLVEEFDGRPHMGKCNNMNERRLRDAYERFDPDDELGFGWLDMYRRFNAFGTFDNAFTDDLGLGEEREPRPTASTTASSEGTSTGDGPGFGPAVALASLGGYALWDHYRDDEDGAESDE